MTRNFYIQGVNGKVRHIPEGDRGGPDEQKIAWEKGV